MGDIPDNEKAWDKLALAEGYKCQACGQRIPFGEQQVFFATKMCGYCAASIDEDAKQSR